MKSSHRCCLFTPGVDAKEAYDNWEAVSVENYGDRCGENLLI